MEYLYARVLASSRRNTEDRAEVFECGDSIVVVVADGSGGMGGGTAAADALVLGVRTVLADDAFELEGGKGWVTLLADLDAMVARGSGGETTAVVVAVTARGVWGISAGDSQAWIVTSNSVDDLTAQQSRKRLGSGRVRPVSFARTSPEGSLIVASDGLWKYASAERIAEVVRGREPDEAADALRALVQLRSGRFQDDLALVVVAEARP